MIPKTETIDTFFLKEGLIQSEIIARKAELIEVLKQSIDRETNDYFDTSKYHFTPVLDEDTPIIRQGTNSNAIVDLGNGRIALKGAVFAEGWDNTGLWELSVEVSGYNPDGYNAIRYSGLILLTSLDDISPQWQFNQIWGISNWEGPVTGVFRGTNGESVEYTKTPDLTLSDGNALSRTIEPYMLHMKKTSLTTLEVWKNNDTENKVIYEYEGLSDVSKVTIGVNTNMASSEAQEKFGSYAFKNLRVNMLSLTDLCEEAKRIQSFTNNVVTLPPQPNEIVSDAIIPRELNIKNKIQYCNNLLRYALKRNGVDPGDCNVMEELIRKLGEIDSVFLFDEYLSDVELSQNKNDLVATYIGPNDINGNTIVEGLFFGNEELYSKTNQQYEDYNNIILNVEMNGEGDIVYTKVRDVLYERGYIEEDYIDIPVQVIWKDNNNTSRRPQSLIVHLNVGNEEIKREVLTPECWGCLFSNLPKTWAGNNIQYRILVDFVPGYQTTIDGFNIIQKLI